MDGTGGVAPSDPFRRSVEWTGSTPLDWPFRQHARPAYDAELPHAARLMSLTVVHNRPLPRAHRPVERLLLFIGAAVRPDAPVASLLERAGAKPVCIGGLNQALQAGAQLAFDGAVVDGSLLHPPEQAWIAKLRQRLGCPLLVLADHADEVDEIIALEQGADDYLVRPVSSRLLSARLKALVRPSADSHRGIGRDQDDPPLAVAGWTLDPARRILAKDERHIVLTELLCALLSLLIECEGRVVSREQLMHRARGLGSHAKTQGIGTYVHRLRRSLQRQGVRDFDIDCLSGRGYLLRSAPAHAEAVAHEA